MLDVKAAASFLGISRSKLYELANRKAIALYRIGGKILFEQADLEAYKRSCRVGVAVSPPPPPPVRLKLKNLSL